MPNLELDKQERTRLWDFLSGSSDDNYYVYILCDNGTPFYVGKGIATRCLQHEAEVEAILEQQGDESLTPAERNELEIEKTEKRKRIEQAKNKDCFNVAIVKFGLTENEAFMVESATINALTFCGYKLTNIVNGHASEKEKDCSGGTKARFLKDMLRECCPEKINLRDVSKIVTNTGSFSFGKDDVAFINYNTYYHQCKDERATWDCVRGCWKMSLWKASRIKYICAVHNNIIKGIFKVKHDGAYSSDCQKISSAEKNMAKLNTPIYKEKSAHDIERIEKVIELLKKNPALKGNAEAIAAELGTDSKNYYERVYFTSMLEDYQNDDDLIDLKKALENRMVGDLKMPQGSVCYLSEKEK